MILNFDHVWLYIYDYIWLYIMIIFDFLMIIYDYIYGYIL